MQSRRSHTYVSQPKENRTRVNPFHKRASGGVYSAKKNDTEQYVAIKQMNLEEQPKKELIINEILVMSSSNHKNIVNFIDSFLHHGDLWVMWIKSRLLWSI